MLSFRNVLNWAMAFICALFILIGRWSPFDTMGDNVLTDFRTLMLTGLFVLMLVTRIRWTVDSKLCLTLLPIVSFGISYAWAYDSGSSAYANSKLFDVFLICLFLLLFRQILHRRGLLNMVLISAGLIATVLGVLALLNAPSAGDAAQNSRISTLGSGPITFARILLTGAIISIAVRFKGLGANLLKILISLVLIYGVLLSGSRGVVAGGLFAFVSLFLIFMLRGSILQKVFAVSGTIGVLFLYYGPQISTGIYVIDHRILALVYNDELYLSGRDMIYATFFRYWPDHPWLGSGLGGFKDVSEFVYPHNLFLEYLFEAGILGFAALTVFLVPILSLCVFKYKTISLQLSALTLSSIGFVMFSGDFYDSRWVFIWGLACLCSAQGNRRMYYSGRATI